MIDTGLLLLRAAGFLLAFTFGIQKIKDHLVDSFDDIPELIDRIR